MRIKNIAATFKTYGFRAGFKFYYVYFISKFDEKNHKIEKFVSIKRLNNDKRPFYVRRNTTDYPFIYVMFGEKGEYDFLRTEKYKDILFNASFIIDGGANIGAFSRIVLNDNPDVKLAAIEPDVGNFSMLERNVKGKNVKLYQGGLWNKKCKLIINNPTAAEFAFKVEESTEDQSGGIDAIPVMQIMADAGEDRIDIFKMDIEGSEYEVLDESAEEWIDSVKLFIIEVHDKYKQGLADRVFTIMQRHGFQHEKIGEDDLFFNMKI